MRATLSSSASPHPVRLEGILEQSALFASSPIVFVRALIAGRHACALFEFNLGVLP